MIGVSDLAYSYLCVTATSPQVVGHARPHNPPQTPLGKRLSEACPSSRAGPRDRAHRGPGPRIPRPRDRRRLSLGPDGRGGFPVHVPLTERGRPRPPHVALLPGQHLEPPDRRERRLRPREHQEATAYGMTTDVDVLVLTPNAPSTPVHYNGDAWNGGRRCRGQSG